MTPVPGILDRPKAYYNIDGVGELGIGFMSFTFALLGWLQLRSPEHSFWNRPYTVMIFIGTMCAIIHYGSNAVKQHITYPRTGFVEYRKRDTVWIPLILGFSFSVVASVLLVMAMRRRWEMTTSASLVGLVFAGSYAHGVARTVRWKWSIVVAMAAGSIGIALLPAEVIGAVADGSWVTRLFPAKAVGAYLGTLTLFGGLMLVSGGITFWSYVRRTQAPAQEEE